MTTADSPRSGFTAHARRRTTVVLFAFALWAIVIIARLSQFMVVQRHRHLAAMARQSVFEGRIPALRGRLLDRNGHLLAWSTRHFAVHWHVPAAPAAASAAWARIATCREIAADWTEAEILDCLGRGIVLREDISPEAADHADRLQGTVTGLRTTSYFVRHRHPDPDVRRLVGMVRSTNGVQVGASGAERTHDLLLRGQAGLYRVLRDRTGAWLPTTWEQVRAVRPGYDVYLPINAPEPPPS